MQQHPGHRGHDAHDDERHRHAADAARRERPDPLEALAGAEPLGGIVGDVAGRPAIQQQAAQRDDEGLQPQPRDQQPCAAPRQPPSATTAASATAGGQPHSTSIIDSSTPSSAQIDPTDRSMPPVMITMPTPMLKMP